MMQADYYTLPNVLADAEVRYLTSIAEPNVVRSGIGGRNTEKTLLRKIKDIRKRRSTSYFFIKGRDRDADDILEKVVGRFQYVANTFYGVDLNCIEPIQYTRYGVFNHYGWHMDTAPIVEDGETARLLSASVELCDPNEYLNGGLEFRDHPNRRPNVKKGTMTCFPSLMIHRARPVFWGSRSSLVLWGGYHR